MVRLITIDFETYYGAGYSLRGSTTEEYLRDRQYQTIGVAVKLGPLPAVWCSGTEEEIGNFLRGFDMHECGVIAHNAMFDMAILNWKFGIRPKLIIDTMSMAKGYVGLATSCSLEKLGTYFKLPIVKGHEVLDARDKRREDFSPAELARYGEYCRNDADMAWQLFLQMAPHVMDSEMKLIDWTVRCFTEPKLVLDAELIDLEYRSFLARRSGLLQQAGIADVSELRSDAKMSDLLIEMGVEPPTKISPATGEITWAFAKTDVEFMDLREHEDERVVALVEARLGSKTSQVQSRLERFRGIASRGTMPVPLLYCGATPTRRWSGTDQINLQNLPRNKVRKHPDKSIVRDATGKPVIDPSPLRRAILAPPGKRMAVGDLSQIELRCNAWQAGQGDVLELLRNGGDTYSDMASTIYAFPVNKKDHPNERFVGKTAVLGCGYQCGGPKFQHMLKVGARREDIVLPDESLDFAQLVVGAYRDKNRQIKNFWYAANDSLEALALGGVRQLGPYLIKEQKVFLPNGSYLYYPELGFREKTGRNEQGCEWSYFRMRHGRKCQTKIYGGKLVENITQAVARLFVSDALLRLQTIKYQDGRPVFDIVNSVHDELVMLFEEGLDDAWVKDVLKWAFTTPPSWAPDIPLAYEGEIGSNYAECK
jgi:DNA polymerase